MIDLINKYLVALLLSMLIISYRDFAKRKWGNYLAIFDIDFILLVIQVSIYNSGECPMCKLNKTLNRLKRLINPQCYEVPILCFYHLKIKDPQLIQKHFPKETLDYNSYKALTENFTKQSSCTKEELIIQKFTDKMKEYNHQKCMKHMAQRLFGVLLEKNIIRANSPQNRLEIYKRMTGFDKAEPYYFLNPFSSKDGSETQKFKEKIKELKEFVKSIDFD